MGISFFGVLATIFWNRDLNGIKKWRLTNQMPRF